MRSTKRTLMLALAILVMVACMLGITSCAHEHEYTETVTPPTCTEGGYTTYTCECGDTYKGNETTAAHTMASVAAKAATCAEAGYNAHEACSVCGYSANKVVIPAGAHTYVSTITAYPTVSTAGMRTYTCDACEYSYTESIDAFTATLPTGADIIAAIIGNAAYTLKMENDTEIVYVHELSDYTKGAEGYKQYITFQLAEATINGEGETLAGHIKLKIAMEEAVLDGSVPTAAPTEPAEIGEIIILLNGDDVSIEIRNPDGSVDEDDYTLSELVYTAVGGMIGLDYEETVELVYIGKELASYAPLAEKIINTIATAEYPTISAEYIESLEALFTALGQNIIAAEVDNDGNTVYTVNFEALNTLIAEVEGKTIAAYLTEVYGENVVKSLADFIKSLPDLTVREIANAAISFAEGTGVSVDEIYGLIDLVVYLTSDTQISISDEIVTRYDMTLAEVIAELEGVEGEEATALITEIKSSINSAAALLETLTFDQLYNLMAYGNPDYIYEDEVFSITAQLKAAIEMIDQSVIVSVTLDEQGAPIAFDIAAFNVVIDLDITENGANLTVTDDGETVASGSVTVTTTTVDEDTTKVVVIDLRDATNDLVDLTVTILNGTVTDINAVVRGYVTDVESVYNPSTEQYEENYVTTFQTIITLVYEDEGETENVVLTIDDVTFNISHVVSTDKEEILFQATVDGDVEAVGKLTVTETSVQIVMGDTTNKLFELYVEVDEYGAPIEALLEVNGYVYNDSTEQYDFVNHVLLGFAFVDNLEGEDFIYLNIMGETVEIGCLTDGDTATITVSDGTNDYLVLTVTQLSNGISFDVLAKDDDGKTLMDAAVSFTAQAVENNVTYTVDVDLDHLQLDVYEAHDPDTGDLLYTANDYLQIDGAISFTMPAGASDDAA